MTMAMLDQGRGAGRQGVGHEDGIVEQCPDGGLQVAWRTPLGSGYAGPAVADGRVFVLDYVETEPRTMDGTERLMALDEETGEVLWAHEWTTTYRMLMSLRTPISSTSTRKSALTVVYANLNVPLKLSLWKKMSLKNGKST